MISNKSHFKTCLQILCFFLATSLEVHCETIMDFMDRQSREHYNSLPDFLKGTHPDHAIHEANQQLEMIERWRREYKPPTRAEVAEINRKIAEANELQRMEYQRRIDEYKARLEDYTLDDAMLEFKTNVKYINKEAALKNKHPKNPKIKLVISDDFWESYKEDRDNRSRYVKKFFNKVERKYFYSDSFSEKSHWFFFAVSASNKERELQSILVKKQHETFIETLAILYAGAKHPELSYYFDEQNAEWLEKLLKKRHPELKQGGPVASSSQSNTNKLSPTDEYYLVNRIKKLIASENNIDTACLYFKRGDRVVGPFSVSNVRDSLKSEKLRSDDYLSDSDEGPWLGVGDSPFSIYAEKKTTE